MIVSMVSHKLIRITSVIPWLDADDCKSLHLWVIIDREFRPVK